MLTDTAKIAGNKLWNRCLCRYWMVDIKVIATGRVIGVANYLDIFVKCENQPISKGRLIIKTKIALDNSQIVVYHKIDY